ncbi:hypothetical protein [Negadavirga shengliensis]|uniref:DUF3955 domain-containing protein n=1 Tax=Negadavirga shengliensis TaxID=1389218 RepID=A0ABV9T1J8_9BACT
MKERLVTFILIVCFGGSVGLMILRVFELGERGFMSVFLDKSFIGTLFLVIGLGIPSVIRIKQGIRKENGS